MKTKISVILLFISLALLIIYGADVMFAQSTSPDGKSGFLQMDHAIRGGVFGGGAVILSIIAFAISLKERSTLVAVLLFINGGLIIAGMVGMAGQDDASKSSTLYGTTGLGVLLVALGVVKVFITRKK
jgi:peptidoglycan/LPS O-acetylase OafA/YrhL